MIDLISTPIVTESRSKTLPIRILIVDDEAMNLKSIVNILENRLTGCQIFQSLDGTKGIDIARIKKPDLIITDWEMPVMNGIEFIEQLKNDPITKDIAVIMCTGVMTTPINLREALEAGAIDYVRKPIDPIELEARVRSAIRLIESFQTIRLHEMNLELTNEHLVKSLNLIKIHERSLEIANTKLKELALTDALTGVANRRRFNESLADEFKITRRTGHEFCVIMFDIDHFKRINDTFGHDQGDIVLKEFAKIAQNAFRESDLVARWGGEEFIILLRHTLLQDTIRLAEELRLSFESHQFELVGKVTASFGIAKYESNDTPDTLRERADKMLYKAKEGGRNRIVH
ncbi:diguanylate cyclase [bacterium]|nr:diguanylate cyclase [bacterium]